MLAEARQALLLQRVGFGPATLSARLIENRAKINRANLQEQINTH